MSRGGALRVLLAELRTVGLDPAAVCVAAAVDPRTLDDDGIAFGVAELRRVLEAAEAMRGDPLLGLHIAERTPGRGVLAYLARAQRTVGDALRSFEQFAASNWEDGGAVRLIERGDEVFFAFQLGALLPRHAVEYLVARTAIGLRRSRAAAGEARFAHARGGAVEEYERVLGCTVRFRQPHTGLSLRAADLARPLRTANREAAAALAAGLAPRPARRSLSVTERLGGAVEEALARGGDLERETLARVLGMSGKTLSRRLAGEQQGFRDVVESVRSARARDLLADRSLSLAEVAGLVGFADAAAFGKACRRWFGVSPSSFRAAERGARRRK